MVGMSGLERFELSNSLLTYVAFRLAALDTFDRLRRVIAGDESENNGFLSELPLLRETAPQVQLELLASTWKKGCDAKLYPPSVVDECVLHCTFERSVGLMLSEPLVAKELLVSGPKPVDLSEFVWLPVRLRTLHLTLPLPSARGAYSARPTVQYPGALAGQSRPRLGVPEPAEQGRDP